MLVYSLTAKQDQGNPTRKMKQFTFLCSPHSSFSEHPKKKCRMMGGEGEEQGIIPRLCRSIFQRISENDNPNVTYKVEVAFLIRIFASPPPELIDNLFFDKRFLI